MDKVVNKMYEMFNIYYNVALQNNIDFIIYTGDNSILFYLAKNNYGIDDTEFSLNFMDKENDYYKYVMVELIKSIFCKNRIYINNNFIYNPIILPNFKIVCNEEDIMDTIKNNLNGYNILNSVINYCFKIRRRLVRRRDYKNIECAVAIRDSKFKEMKF